MGVEQVLLKDNCVDLPSTISSLKAEDRTA